MHWPASSVMQTIDTQVPRQLVSGRQWEGCLSLTRRLTIPIGSYHFECRLVPGEHPIEFSVMLVDRADTRDKLSVCLGSSRAAPHWTRILNLLGAWSGEDRDVSDVPVIWLGFDVSDCVLQSAIPTVSIAIDACEFDPSLPRSPGDHAEVLARARASLMCLVAQERLAPVLTLLSRVVRLLPSEGTIAHISETFRRDPAVTKLHLRLPKDYVVLFLSQLGWTGNVADVRRALSTNYDTIEHTVYLELSIERGILSDVGMTFCQSRRQEMDAFDPSWSHLTMESVTSEKRQAFARWPGASHVVVDGTRTCLRRWVDIKMALENGRPPSFKACLGFAPELSGDALFMATG